MATLDLQAQDTAARAQAVGALHTNLALAAGAGSGKTTVLTDRVVALLRAGTPPERLAAITFTECQKCHVVFGKVRAASCILPEVPRRFREGQGRCLPTSHNWRFCELPDPSPDLGAQIAACARGSLRQSLIREVR